ncbi:MAG: T9SS type A sorting domain-containing protein [Saprospiraceae bacterium]
MFTPTQRNRLSRPITILSQPQDATTCSGKSFDFQAAADPGTFGNMTYKWQVSSDGLNWVNIDQTTDGGVYSGFNSNHLSVASATGLYGLYYRMGAKTDLCSWVFTDAAEVTVQGPVFITEQPKDFVTCSDYAIFTVDIEDQSLDILNEDYIQYQWETSADGGATWGELNNGLIGGTPQGDGVNGVFTDSLVIIQTQGKNGHLFRVKIWSEYCDTLVSDAALLIVENDISFVSYSGDIITCGGEPGLVTATFEQNDGSPIPIYYQWQISSNNGITYGDVFNGSAYQGTDTDSLLIVNTSNLNGYRCRLKAWTGTCDTLYSPYSLIKINNPLTVYLQPAGIQACEDDEVFFTVGVDDPIDPSGSQIQYQWEILIPNSPGWQPIINGPTFNGINIFAGEHGDTLLIAPLTGLNGAYVRAVAWKDNCDPVVSDPALIDLSGTVHFTTQPQDVSVCSGNAFCFTVEAEYLNGGGNFNYQWEYSISANPGTWIVIVNPTQLPNMTINGNQLCFSSPQDVNQYKFRAVVWSNQCSYVNSQIAEVNVGGIFSVVENPEDAEACAGDEVLFAAQISAPASQDPVNYQWQYSLDGINWTDATSSIFEGTTTEELLITDVTGMDGWHFRLQGYIDGCDPAYSESAILKLLDNAICNPKHVELSIKYFPSTPASSYWGVFLKPATGFDPTGDNVLTSGEVTIAASQGFIYKNLKSQAGGMWKAGAVYITQPGQTGLNYFSFVLTPNSIPLNLTHEEVMLFSFSKKEDCPDELFLIDDVYPTGIHPNTITGIESGNSPDEYFSLGGYYESEMGGCGGMTKDPEDPNETTTNITGNNGSGNVELSFEPSIEQPAFQFAPNPADEMVDIRFSALEKDAVAFLRLVNVQGQVLQKQPLINTNQLRLDLTPYTSGLYFLLLEVDGEIWQEGKLVKR